MTISIDSNPKVFFNGLAPKYLEYQLTLVSRWSRKEIQQDGIVYDFQLGQPLIWNDRYTEWDLNPDQILEKFDLQGWYDYYLEGSDDGTNWARIEIGSIKIKNSSERQLDQKVKYDGPNPGAENYIIY